jgi:hypothetical protein
MKAEPGAVAISGTQLSEPLRTCGQLSQLGVVESGAGIVDGAMHVVSCSARDGDFGRCRCVAVDIAREVCEHPLEQGLVALHKTRVTRDLDASLRVEHSEIGEMRAHQRSHVHESCRPQASRGKPGEQQEIVDEPRHAT